MELYFLRHAEAEDGADDDARELTAKGRKDAAKIGTFLQRANIKFDAAYSTSLVRARQTAEIVLETCECLEGSGLEISAALLNETALEEFMRWLRALRRANHVLLVGHSPSTDARVAALLGLSAADGLKFPKGGLACVETENFRSGRLRFFIRPKLL